MWTVGLQRRWYRGVKSSCAVQRFDTPVLEAGVCASCNLLPRGFTPPNANRKRAGACGAQSGGGDAPNTPAPPFWGVRVRKDYDLHEVFKYINESALFKNQWQLKTASQSDYVRLVEEKFKPIKKRLEDEVAASGLFDPKVVYGYFPAQSDGNDIVIYETGEQPSSRSAGQPGACPEPVEGAHVPTQARELLRFTFPRQR